MSIYRRDPFNPEWEPAPWPMDEKSADQQEAGFHRRASKPIIWLKISWDDVPDDGIFGQDKDWLLSRDVEYIASLDGEDLILICNAWFGFPDPPEWGLASRPTGQADAAWRHWGHFPDIPKAWVVPLDDAPKKRDPGSSPG